MTKLLNTLLILFVLTPIARGVDLPDLARLAISSDPAQSAPAIQALRQAGPAGLDALFTTHQSLIAEKLKRPDLSTPQFQTLSAALDAVARQRDAWSAHLYWYTDLDAAKKAAADSSKPILSLRLLGTLDTEFSCANSRFFRTVLYPNAQVNQYLRDHFILHWQSHRPVPRLTIDFGDGRTIERTITGNSVHYLLTPDGKVIDVLPGLYGPQAFLRELKASQELAKAATAFDFPAQRIQYHQTKLAQTLNAWTADLTQAGVTIPAIPTPKPELVINPTAISATRIALAKSAAELPAVTAITPKTLPATIPQPTTDNGQLTILLSITNDQAWNALAQLHSADAQLDDASYKMIVSKTPAKEAFPDAVTAGRRAASKALIENPLAKMIRTFQSSVAQDTVRNQYALHSQIHTWFIQNQAPQSLDDLNEKVYAELFLMPKSDPYLGLVPSDTYTALSPTPATK